MSVSNRMPMKAPSQTLPRTPVGSLFLITMMYLLLLLHFLGPRQTPGSDDLGFPGGIIVAFFCMVYCVAAIILPIRLFRHRDTSAAHRIAFYASLGILIVAFVLIWPWQD